MPLRLHFCLVQILTSLPHLDKAGLAKRDNNRASQVAQWKRTHWQHRRWGFHPWVRRIPLEEGMATPSRVLAWRATGHREAESETWLKQPQICTKVRAGSEIHYTCQHLSCVPVKWKKKYFSVLKERKFKKKLRVSILMYLCINFESASRTFLSIAMLSFPRLLKCCAKASHVSIPDFLKCFVLFLMIDYSF